MSKDQPTPLTQMREGRLPGMVRWYDPGLLFKIAIRTSISSVFGQYADQRIVQAATDPSTEKEITSRYDYSQPDPDPDKTVALDDTGALWVDYIADTGDGFEATYTMAYLLASDELRVNDADNKSRLSLKAGHILIMGGDQCYPQATREGYKKRLTTPFNWAFDVPQPERKLFAIPGNHDWYDGLNAFDSLFCSSRDRLSGAQGEQIGGWQCHQNRSYWALQLPYNWWIWGTDIQFSAFLDTPQVSYFKKMAEQIRPGDKLVLCIAEPSWLLSDFGQDDEDENFFTITRIAREAGAEIVAVIAGDWHVYARYFAPELGERGVHFITAGGGGAFLHPTHVLKNEISVQWPKQVVGVADAAAPHGGYGPPPPGWMKETVDINLKSKSKSNTASPAGGVAERVGEVIQDARTAAREVAHDVAKDVHAPPQVERALRGRAHATRNQDAKCYPGRGLSVLLSLGNLLFPFRNIWFALFIGLVYWLITWQFYTLVTEHDISAGAIDAIGLMDATGKQVTFWEVYKYTPFYLIQGLLVSLWLAAMLGGLYATLIWYVDASGRSRFRGALRKFFIGTTHFAAHVALMFALGLVFVQFHNRISPTLHAFAESIWLDSGKDGDSMAGAVARKVLEPLSTERQADVKRYQAQRSGADATVTRRAPPPAISTPSQSNKIDPKSFRQIVGFVLYPIEMIILGGIAGGFVWGLYWVVTGVFFRMHAEDAFAALRIDSYKNFLRFKFEPDKLTIYPIGVDSMPDRKFWTAREGARSVPRHNPQLIAPTDIAIRLIERPIVIHAGPRTPAS